MGRYLSSLQAQLKYVRRGLGFDLIARARDRVKHASEFEMLNYCGHRRRAIRGKRDAITSFQLEHEWPELQRRPEHFQKRRIVQRTHQLEHALVEHAPFAGTSAKHLRGRVEKRGILLGGCERRLAGGGEDRIVVSDIRLAGFEQDAVSVENNELDH